MLAAPTVYSAGEDVEEAVHRRPTSEVQNLPAGAIGLDERLHRLESNDQQILIKLESLARATDQEALVRRVEIIERAYVGKSTVTAVIVFSIVQFLVIIGLGLGLIYEFLKK